MKKHYNLVPLIGYLILFAYLLIRGFRIINPLVLPDETAYINLIAKLSKTLVFDGAQYPPLYPLMASSLYDSNNNLLSYKLIRFFNVFVFSLAFFPMYFLIKNIIDIDTIKSTLLTLSVLLLPWSSLITPIWAEPLYFCLFSLCFLLAYLSLKHQKIILHTLLGVAVGMTFLTKQAGLIIGISFVLTQFVLYIYFPNKKKILLNSFAFLAPLVFIVLSYKYLNSTGGSSGIGYSNVVDAMTSRIFKILQKKELYQSFFHQIVYLAVATFFILFAAFFMIFKEFKKINTDIKLFALFLFFTTLGFCSLIAIFNNTVDVSYNDTNEPQLTYGRYLVAIIPYFYILGTYFLIHFKNINFKYYRSSFLILFLMTGLFTPLYSTHVSGIIGSPDITYLCQFLGESFPPWDRTVTFNHILENSWKVSLLFVLISIALFYANKKNQWIFITAIFLLAAYVGDKNYKYTVEFSQATTGESIIYQTIATTKTPLSKVLILNDFKPGIYISQFWNGFFDFEKWKTTEVISSNDISLKNPKLMSNEYKFILADKYDLQNIPTFFEYGERKIILIKDLIEYLSKNK